MTVKLFQSTTDSAIEQIFSNRNIFIVPQYQRSYKWNDERLLQLNNDILEITDGDAETEHFLGAVIINPVGNDTTKNIFNVIDGQQRLTTIYLYILAAATVAAENNKKNFSKFLIKKYLILTNEYQSSNLCLRPSPEDQQQLYGVFDRLMKMDKDLQKLIKFRREHIPSREAVKRGRILKNFNIAYTFFLDQFKKGRFSRLEKITNKILNSFIIVQLVIKKPEDGPKIFDTLNSRQYPMTIGDLVRNEIFNKAVKAQGDIHEIDQEVWQPFYEKFKHGNKSYFDSYFFPFGLILDSNLKKTQVYNSLRIRWSKFKDASSIIQDLSIYQNAFLDIVKGENSQNLNKDIFFRVQRISRMNAPTAAYPFYIKLLFEIQNKKISIIEGKKILDVIESFLVRRALCGIEPTGLHAVFKKLWKDCGANPKADKVIRAIKKHKTVAWPDDETIKDAILNRKLYKSGIARYFLEEYDLSFKGEVSKKKSVEWIEHILPQTLTSSWNKSFSKEEHELYCHTLPNLLPVTNSFNSRLSNKSFTDKRKAYQKDSMFKSTRDFADKYEDWNLLNLEKRGKAMFTWAKNHWKY